MKWLVSLCTLFIVQVLSAQSTDVRISSFPTELKQGAELQFEVETGSVLEAEIAVFADRYLGYRANASLQPGKHVYKTETRDWPAGKYYILVKSEKIHLQEVFLIIP